MLRLLVVVEVLRGLWRKTLGLLLLMLLLLNLVLQMRRQEAHLRWWGRRRVEGRGSAHERMVGAVVLQEKEDQTISVWQLIGRLAHFILQSNMQRGEARQTRSMPQCSSGTWRPYYSYFILLHCRTKWLISHHLSTFKPLNLHLMSTIQHSFTLFLGSTCYQTKCIGARAHSLPDRQTTASSAA